MKKYLDKNVYEAARERIAFCFSEFEHVLVSFSGGKDSGVMLNLCYDYAKETGQLDKLAVYHLDYEAQYQMTTDYVSETFEKDFREIKKYWLCLPVEAQCACRMDGAFWTPWAKESREIWAREMPQNKFVINEDNAPFPVKRGLTDNEIQDAFCRWFADKHGTTALLIGIRSDESFDRYKLVTSRSKSLKTHRYKNLNWTVESGNVCRVYPIYDWTVHDVWTYFSRTGARYNKLYDLYYKAGLSVDQMRVASPFNNCAGATLKLYKVIDPRNWAKLVGRVNGANFAGLYGGTTAMGWKSITLPKGHTWKSYCYFLLSTLPEKVRRHYERILATSIEYWCLKGGLVAEELAPELEALKADITDCGKSPRFQNQRILKFAKYPDDVDAVHFSKFPSYKRMCVCIMKNDYYCVYMGFSRTQEAIEKRKKVLEKYKNL